MVAAAIISVTAIMTAVHAVPAAYSPMSERSRVSSAMNANRRSSRTALIACDEQDWLQRGTRARARPEEPVFYGTYALVVGVGARGRVVVGNAGEHARPDDGGKGNQACGSARVERQRLPDRARAGDASRGPTCS
jgi:hypothetical protein